MENNNRDEIDFNDPNQFKKQLKKEVKKANLNLNDAPKGLLITVMNHKGKIAVLGIYFVLSGLIANISWIVSFVKFLIP